VEIWGNRHPEHPLAQDAGQPGFMSSASYIKRYGRAVISVVVTPLPFIPSSTLRTLSCKLRRLLSLNCSAISRSMPARVSRTPHWGHENASPDPWRKILHRAHFTPCKIAINGHSRPPRWMIIGRRYCVAPAWVRAAGRRRTPPPALLSPATEVIA